MMCKFENEEHDYYDRYGIITPSYTQKPKQDESGPDLITIHIYKDQIVKLTEDVLRWIFHKIKGAFKKKKKKGAMPATIKKKE